MDENRMLSSNPEGLGQFERLMRRDRNHPSVFIWSLAEDEPMQSSPAAARIAATMQELVHRLDPTRQCTAATTNGRLFGGINKVIDVRGWSGDDWYDLLYHRDRPRGRFSGVEEGGLLSTRGIYVNDRTQGYFSSYADHMSNSITPTGGWWTSYADLLWLAGGFLQSGFDFMGASAPSHWPNVISQSGAMDLCGFPKDDFYYYQSCWSDRPMVHLLPHWNWLGNEGQEVQVHRYANGEEVELLLNGQNLGRKPIAKNLYQSWTVKYAPGTLLARSYRNGKVVAEDKVETTGAPTTIRLIPDRAVINADGEDLSIITVAAQDAQGRTVPDAQNVVRFSVFGPGKIIAIGNGDPSSHSAGEFIFGTAPWQRRVFNGLEQLIVQSEKEPGTIELTARSAGLSEAHLNITVQPAQPRPSAP